METYGNLLRGNLWELMGTYGTYGNLWSIWELHAWELMRTHGNLWELCAWELMVTYESFVHGNLWELMGIQCVGTYENLMSQKSWAKTYVVLKFPNQNVCCFIIFLNQNVCHSSNLEPKRMLGQKILSQNVCWDKKSWAKTYDVP